MAITYRGTSGVDSLEGRGTFSDNDVRVYGLGGNDVLGAAWETNAIIYGGSGNDTINGHNLWDKILYGGSGNDKIEVWFADGQTVEMYGGSGSDTLSNYASDVYAEVVLDGGSGADRMYGDDSRDIYVVDNKGDKTIETFVRQYSNTYNPQDEVRSSIDWTLGDRIEILVLTGTSKIDGNGNGLSNHITGNAAGNILKGGGGHDTLMGGKGSDKLYGDTANDKLYSGSGEDRLYGGSGKDKLYGDSGSDRLTGGSDADRLWGGSSSDRFVFTETSDSRRTSMDVIEDFVRGFDRIDFSQIDAKYKMSGNQDFRFIGTKEFSERSGEMRFENGSLQGDVNGDGVSDIYVGLTGITAISASDLIL